MSGGAYPKVEGEDDPLGHGMGFILKDSYRAKVPEKGEPDAMDVMSIGLNGYGDFVLVGHGCQVIRIPDEERIKLAAHLLAPILEMEPLFLPAAKKEMADHRANKEVPPQLRAQKPTVGAKPKRGGIIARS